MKRVVSVLVLVAVLAPMISGCGTREVPDAALSDRIAAKAEAGTGTVIDLATIADFEWESLYIFGPYTPVDEIDRALGFRWNDARYTRIDMLDGIALLVFVKGDEVVRYVEHPRNRGDFATVARPEPWSMGDQFEIVEVDDLGSPWLEVRPAAP